MITLDRLSYFIEVATIEHVGKAARNKNVSASVISSAIQLLEEEFDCKLFIREHNRLRLNEQGAILLEKAKILIENANNLHKEISGNNLKIKGHFKLGGSHFLVNQYLIPALLEIKTQNPLLTAEFISIDTGAAITHVLNGDLDGAIIFRTSLNYDLEETILKESQFVIAVRKKHEILQLPLKKRVELLNELPAITFKTSMGPIFPENHPVFKEHLIIPRHTFLYADDQSVIQLLQRTNGWALLPLPIVEKYSSHIEKVQVSKKWYASVMISFIRNKNKTSNQLTSQLLSYLVSEFKN